MSEAMETTPAAASAVERTTARSAVDHTDRPIPLWPEGVLVVAAGVTLLVVALRHRTWVRRKFGEAQRAVEEFQKQGGIDDVVQVARQAVEFVRGG
jgi:hypothetical protein